MKITVICAFIALCVIKNAVSQTYLIQSLNLTELVKDGLVRLHNTARAQEPATNMLMMSWDEEIASIAKTHAAGCAYEHSDPQTLRTDDFPELGENIYFPATYDEANTHKINIFQFLTAWYHEKPNYSIEYNICDEGEQCGHYTQMVWASSYKLGCGAALCSSEIEEEGVLVVCNYGPRGNLIGRSPYTIGEPCENCGNSSDVCVSNLCANSNRGDVLSTAVSPTETDTTLETMEEVLENSTTTQADAVLETTQPSRETTQEAELPYTGQSSPYLSSTQEIQTTPSTSPTVLPEPPSGEPTTRSPLVPEITSASHMTTEQLETSKAPTRTPVATTDIVFSSPTYSSPFPTTPYPTGQPTSTRAPPSACGSEDLKKWRESFRQWKRDHKRYVEKYLDNEV